MKRKGLVGAIAMAVLIFGGLILTLFCTSRVPAGYVGVVYNMNGGVDGEVLSQGWHVVSPTKNVTLYSIGIEQSWWHRVQQHICPICYGRTGKNISHQCIVALYVSVVMTAGDAMLC